MTTLVIVESPGKIKKLSTILGSDYRVVASVGHVRDLPDKSLGVAPPDFRPTYVATERGKSVLTRLRTSVKECEHVLLATDPDREGEAIAWHLADALGLARAQRITFTAITPSAVHAALAVPRPIDKARVCAQEARRVLDRLVGYRVSPALSNRAGQKLTAGRVQSPAVRLVVDREREIQAFASTEHYGALLRFTDSAGDWTAEWLTKPHLPPEQNYILDQAQARRVAGVRDVVVSGFQDAKERRGPKAPFTTSTLQQVAGVRLNFKPKRIMELAQRLYEQGVISYHRTDSPNLSAEAMDDVASYADRVGWPLASPRRQWKAKAGAQEGHEAIRPTSANQVNAGETDDEQALYRLIRSRAIASQLADAEYDVRTAELGAVVQALADIPALPVTFVARGRTLTAPGWQVVYDAAGDEEEAQQQDARNPLPALTLGLSLTAVGGELLTKTTKAPARFKLSSLVAELERQGIGRPSTYATILDNITARAYIVEDARGFLSPTGSGEAIRDALVGRFQFADLDYTRALEDELDQIASDTTTYEAVITAAWHQLTTELDGLETVAVTVTQPDAIVCPVCGAGQLRRIKGTKGYFWGCSAYREGCKASFDDNRGKPGIGGKTAAPCPVCKEGVLRSRTGPKGKFWGCSRYPECKASAPDKRNRPDLAAMRPQRG